MDRGVPVFQQLIVHAQQSDGATRHFERGDVVADEGTRDGDIFAVQDVVQGIVDLSLIHI